MQLWHTIAKDLFEDSCVPSIWEDTTGKKRDYSGAKLKDYYAIMKDWRSVGDDIWKAEKQFKPAGK